MKPALRQLLDRYEPVTRADFESALREIAQELALLGLWRARFFEHASFYGGTALRIFHGLRRFSEDLDFSLLAPKPGFRLAGYLGAVEDELTAHGFAVEVVPRGKAVATAVESAFLKASTAVNLLRIGAPVGMVAGLPASQVLRVKIEIDTNPPPGAGHEVRTLFQPIPFQVRLFRLPDLFAGKVHALLWRKWGRRVKGRDFYDFVWYVGRGVECHLAHLEARMRQSGHWGGEGTLTADALRDLLVAHFERVDLDAARRDVLPFLRDRDEVALWSAGFFKDLAGRMLVEDQPATG